ncbi:hypothetical protein KA021_01550 [Candidatus Saccharibacteria bacterium]|jgi:glutathione synthase/RimK-type ligase-like ATP-grasp enzyme|nr:hypothetical protein [Candidatus Saccharibacteria bacterium]
MKNVLIFGSSDYSEKNDSQVVAKAFGKNRANVTFVPWEELIFTINNSNVSIRHNDVELADLTPDTVLAFGWYKSGRKSIYKDVAYALALYLDHHKIPYWNSEMGRQRSTGKLSCLVLLALNNIAVTPTAYSLRGDLLMAQITLPAVLKASSASRGDSNYFVDSKKQAEVLLVGMPNRLLVQPYLDNNHDLRMIMFGGKVHRILKRARRKDATTHLNNTSQGGSAEWISTVSVDKKLLTICEKICKITHREMAGIDLIPDNISEYGYSCLEVNTIPQLTSGFDPDTKMESLVEAVLKN